MFSPHIPVNDVCARIEADSLRNDSQNLERRRLKEACEIRDWRPRSVIRVHVGLGSLNIKTGKEESICARMSGIKNEEVGVGHQPPVDRSE
jgi:hypothetical protein